MFFNPIGNRNEHLLRCYDSGNFSKFHPEKLDESSQEHVTRVMNIYLSDDESGYLRIMNANGTS